MERNDIQKISSETANIPVYKQSAEYAIEHDELPVYRESFRVNMACRDALEKAIHESYPLKKDCWAIAMRTCFCTPLWTPCLGRQDWEI